MALDVVRVPVLRFLPADHFARVFDKDFTFRNILHGKHALAMHARAARLDAALVAASLRHCRVSRDLFFGHGGFLVWLIHAGARVSERAPARKSLL